MRHPFIAILGFLLTWVFMLVLVLVDQNGFVPETWQWVVFIASVCAGVLFIYLGVYIMRHISMRERIEHWLESRHGRILGIVIAAIVTVIAAIGGGLGHAVGEGPARFGPLTRTVMPRPSPISDLLSTSLVMAHKLIAQVPALICLGDQILLVVTLALLPGSPRPSKSRRVKLSVSCPGFRFHWLSEHAGSEHIRYLDISLGEDLFQVVFFLQAQEEGEHEIRVSAFFGGTYLNSLIFKTEVAPNVETGPDQLYYSNIEIGEPETGEVTVQVDCDARESVYKYQLNSATFEEDRVFLQPFVVSPKASIEKLVQDLGKQAAYPVNDSDASVKLKRSGIELWNQFIPKELNQLFWDHRQDIEKLTILSDGIGQMIPWEAMYPVSKEGESAGFLVDQLIVARRFYGDCPAKTFRFSKRFFVLPNGKSVPRGEKEVNTIEGILGGGSEIRDLKTLRHIIREEKVDLLHFACDYSFNEDDLTASYILFKEGDFQPEDLNLVMKRFKQTSPLIFMNCCRSGGVAAHYTRFVGWADHFLQEGAGAFIGTLWEVNDQSASLFAEKFYRALSQDTLLGEAMRQARSAIHNEASNDPTWLAYILYGNPDAKVSVENVGSTPLGSGGKGNVVVKYGQNRRIGRGFHGQYYRYLHSMRKRRHRTKRSSSPREAEMSK